MTKRKLVCAYATNCELLDELSEENEELKSENQYLKSLKWNRDCINEISIGMQQRQSLEISNNKLVKENEQLKSDKEHLMGCLIRFFGYDDEDIDYNLNRESNREYGKQYYSMKEETKKELEK